jgi:hypothetical protein
LPVTQDTITVAVNNATRTAIVNTITHGNFFIIDNIDGSDDVNFYWDSTTSSFFTVPMGWQYVHEFPIRRFEGTRFPLGTTIGYMQSANGTFDVKVIVS